jgi:hypothetical protein
VDCLNLFGGMPENTHIDGPLVLGNDLTNSSSTAALKVGLTSFLARFAGRWPVGPAPDSIFSAL